jgi:hypothetical protein
MLINGVYINIKLTRTQKLFIYCHLTMKQKYYQNFRRIVFITLVELKPTLLLAHANVLAMKRKAHYHITHAN